MQMLNEFQWFYTCMVVQLHIASLPTLFTMQLVSFFMHLVQDIANKNNIIRSVASIWPKQRVYVTVWAKTSLVHTSDYTRLMAHKNF